jgi:hypothetical protein
MKRTASILTLVAVVSMLGVSDVRGGAALLPAGKTTGPALTATIVMDVTGGPNAQGKGLTSIRVQKAGTSVAAIFQSSSVASFVGECIAIGFADVETSTASRFTGLIDGLVDTQAVLTSLFGQFGIPNRAAITDQDYVTCTEVNGRKILAFTAVIQFKQ